MTVVDAEHLSKRYMICHQQTARYTTFRETLARGANSFARQLVHPFRSSTGQPFRATTTEAFYALKDVSFKVDQGDRLAIIGRNGAGKSTLLKILSRITEPTAGRVRIRGRVASLLEVGTGFHPELTGRENIFLNGAILGMSRTEIRQRFDEIVAFAEVEKFLDTPVKRYSSGMYVRLAFAVAAHLEPEILIVDEVLAVGDAQFQKKCLGKMGEVGQEGRTVLFVSHNMNAVKRLCRSGIHLQDGCLQAVGDVNQIVQGYLSGGFGQVANRDIPRHTHRVFTGDIEVFQVEILDRFREQTESVRVGEAFSIKVSWRIHNPELGYRLGLILRSADETRLATIVNAAKGEVCIKGEKGRAYSQTVQLHNVFSPGRYHIDINVKDSFNRCVDAIDGVDFAVGDEALTGMSTVGTGLVTLEHAWSGIEHLA